MAPYGSVLGVRFSLKEGSASTAAVLAARADVRNAKWEVDELAALFPPAEGATDPRGRTRSSHRASPVMRLSDIETTGDADLAAVVADAERSGAKWVGGQVVLDVVFASLQHLERAAAGLAKVATNRVSVGADLEVGAQGPQATAIESGVRDGGQSGAGSRLRARIVAAYRPRRRDPLSAPIIAVPLSAAMLLAWVLAFVLFQAAGPNDELPGVALGSKVLLDVVRATLVVGLIGAGAALLLRAAFGNFPSEISTQGVRWNQDEVEERSVRQEQLTTVGALVATLHERVARLERRAGG
ncbi:MAG: hypothetical protein M3295_01455 [Chloroflexota bacterium]|nr:hypothetical protein [Chloroflexota bacterium]